MLLSLYSNLLHFHHQQNTQIFYPAKFTSNSTRSDPESMDETSAPLNICRVLRTNLIINRLHIFLNGIAILSVFYYRATTFSHLIQTELTPLLPYTIVVIAEIVLTFLWILHQATRWRPVKRTVYTERLPEEEELPAVDVFVCTADPSKEPPLGVMNTVISALSLDYPPHKLAVYLSDDGGSHVTLHAVREAWRFAGFWVPFCRKYGLKCRCPEAYFATEEIVDDEFGEFVAEKKIIEKKYGEFRESLEKNSVNASASVSRDHSATIEVMRDGNGNSSLKDMPLLVYVAREKRPAHPHHFKGGALNVLLRVSALMSNAPYFLVLDCDMYCDDPSSAHQAMCFYLDPKLSPQIGWVQFPQKFRNIDEHDVYDGRLHHIWREGLGLDGLRGPPIYGCNFFMRREAIYGTHKIQKDIDLNRLKKAFGSSNEFIKSIYKNYEPQLGEDREPSVVLQKELQLLASCGYDIDTEWGEDVGYRYFSVLEDTITSLELHCNGWISVLIDPARPCFLGASPTNLSDMLVQQTRWSFGLMQIGLSRFSPLIYGPLRMSTLQSMSYAAFILDPLYTLPFYTLGIVSPICLLYNIPLYPKASEPIFIAFAYIFLSSQLKHVQEVISYGDSFTTALYELRAWMMKSGTCYIFGLSDAIMDKIGLHDANFNLTSKVVDDEQARHHELGIYDFQASTWLLAPLCSVYILNLASFVVGGARIFLQRDELVAQLVLSLFGVVVNYHLLEGMVLRKDSGRVPPFASWLAVVITAVFLCCGSVLLLF